MLGSIQVALFFLLASQHAFCQHNPFSMNHEVLITPKPLQNDQNGMDKLAPKPLQNYQDGMDKLAFFDVKDPLSNPNPNMDMEQVCILNN